MTATRSSSARSLASSASTPPRSKPCGSSTRTRSTRSRCTASSFKTPRWQQAYGADYKYTGNVNRALPVPASLAPLHAFCRTQIDERLNGLLLNWYDPAREQYIGKHRDSTVDMVEGAPIVTVSYGGERAFRLRPWKAEGFRDFAATDGSVFVLPYDTNLAFTHEVPHAASSRGRRISVTLRAFHPR